MVGFGITRSVGAGAAGSAVPGPCSSSFGGRDAPSLAGAVGSAARAAGSAGAAQPESRAAASSAERMAGMTGTRGMLLAQVYGRGSERPVGGGLLHAVRSRSRGKHSPVPGQSGDASNNAELWAGSADHGPVPRTRISATWPPSHDRQRCLSRHAVEVIGVGSGHFHTVPGKTRQRAPRCLRPERTTQLRVVSHAKSRTFGDCSASLEASARWLRRKTCLAPDYSATSATSGSSPPANVSMRSVYSGSPRV